MSRQPTFAITWCAWCATALAASFDVSAREVVPVRFVDSVPVVQLRLAETVADFVLDTGGQIGISVPPPLISESTKVRLVDQSRKMTDAAGHVFDVKQLVASTVQMGTVELGPVKGQVHYKWGLHAGDGSSPTVLANGAVGLAAIFPRNIEFDFHAGRLVIFEPGEEFDTGKNGAWIRIPFEYDARGIVLTLTVDGVRASFSLDSPATATVVRMDSPIFRSSPLPCKVEAAQNGFCGLTTFTSVKSGSDALDSIRAVVVKMGPVPLDGLLGVDFFQTHRIFVNFSRHFAYVQSVSNGQM
jgi:hypothetical protein